MTTPRKTTPGKQTSGTARASGGPPSEKAGGKAGSRPGAKAGGKASSTKASGAKASATAEKKSVGSDGHRFHDITVTVPVDHAAEAAKRAVAMPVHTAQRVLPAKGGLPLYLGLGALGVVGVLEWPVAVGIGVGYAVLRRAGPLDPSDGATK